MVGNQELTGFRGEVYKKVPIVVRSEELDDNLKSVAARQRQQDEASRSDSC